MNLTPEIITDMASPITGLEVLLFAIMVAVAVGLYWFMDFDDTPKVPRDLWHGEE